MRLLSECYEIARNPISLHHAHAHAPGSCWPRLEDEELKVLRRHVHKTYDQVKVLGARYAVASKELRDMCNLLDRYYDARKAAQRHGRRKVNK